MEGLKGKILEITFDLISLYTSGETRTQFTVFKA
jgi:hypothetical protein